MNWRYQIIEHDEWDDPEFAIHEAYLDDDGEPTSVTADPVSFVAESEEALVSVLISVLSDATYGSLPMTKFLE